MKKYIFYIIGLIVINILVTLAISTNLVSAQQKYQELRLVEKELQEKNTRLAREVAHLSSLNRISEAADNLGLTDASSGIVYIKEYRLATIK